MEHYSGREAAQFGYCGEVNRNDYYLGRVAALVLFGSILRPEVDRLSDVDVAVDVVQKEPDRERARQTNYGRARELEAKGYAFPPARTICWKTESSTSSSIAAG